MFPRRSLVAALALALACVSSTTHAAGLETDPYTLPDGSVVDPTDPNSANRPRDNSDTIYMPLSNDGPMAGMGPHAHPARGLSQQVGIRSEDDDGFEV